jgi:hypothetical protein
MSVGCGGQSGQGPEPPKPKAKAKHLFTELPADKWVAAEVESEMDPTVMPFDPTHAAGTASQVAARFRGKDRAGAKTSIADGAPMLEFASVVKLQDSLPGDDEMQHHDPPITRQSNERMSEELRNVHVSAWIYAIKYETDNDWHLITGTDPSGDPRYFNAEVSGLPSKTAASYAKLLGVRKSLADILNDDLPGPGSYRKYDPPIAVTIEGSVFYDVDHEPGAVGPGDMKPTTAWEIHPITGLMEQ